MNMSNNIRLPKFENIFIPLHCDLSQWLKMDILR